MVGIKPPEVAGRGAVADTEKSNSRAAQEAGVFGLGPVAGVSNYQRPLAARCWATLRRAVPEALTHQAKVRHRTTLDP